LVLAEACAAEMERTVMNIERIEINLAGRFSGIILTIG
jgi:hypothetical protein